MDAVLYYGLRPIFTGSPEETVRWLEQNPQARNLKVRVGETSEIVSVTEYLSN